jgi:hypothetical protein
VISDLLRYRRVNMRHFQTKREGGRERERERERENERGDRNPGFSCSLQSPPPVLEIKANHPPELQPTHNRCGPQEVTWCDCKPLRHGRCLLPQHSLVHPD